MATPGPYLPHFLESHLGLLLDLPIQVKIVIRAEEKKFGVKTTEKSVRTWLARGWARVEGGWARVAGD